MSQRRPRRSSRAMIGSPVLDPRTGRPGRGACALVYAASEIEARIDTMPTTPRIPPIEPPYEPAVEEQLRKWMPPGAEVEPLRLFRTLMVHPELSSRMRPLGAALLGHPTVEPREREIVIHRSTALAGAEYEWGVHAVAF